MQLRTFFRTMFQNFFIENVFIKTFFAIINFCNNYYLANAKKLKFYNKMPLYKKEAHYHKNFLFKNNYRTKFDENVKFCNKTI